MEDDFSLEDYFAELKMMFSSKGWYYLTQELQSNASVIDNLQAVSDNDDLKYRQGQLDTIGVMLNFPDTIERAEAEQPE